MCKLITELLNRCIHEEFLINDDEDVVLDMQWDDNDSENALLDDDIQLSDSTECIVGADAGELAYFDVIGQVVNAALVDSLFPDEVQDRPRSDSDQVNVTLEFKSVEHALPVHHKAWHFIPSVGSWLLPRRTYAEDMVRPTESVLPAWTLQPSVGTWLLPRSSKVDVRSLTSSVPFEGVEISPNHLSWNMSASVGTWLLPLPRKQEPSKHTKVIAPPLHGEKLQTKSTAKTPLRRKPLIKDIQFIDSEVQQPMRISMVGSAAGGLRRLVKEVQKPMIFRLDEGDLEPEPKTLKRKDSLSSLYESLGKAEMFRMDADECVQPPCKDVWTRTSQLLLKAKPYLSTYGHTAMKTAGSYGLSRSLSLSALTLDLGLDAKQSSQKCSFQSTIGRCSSVGALKPLSTKSLSKTAVGREKANPGSRMLFQTAQAVWG